MAKHISGPRPLVDMDTLPGPADLWSICPPAARSTSTLVPVVKLSFAVVRRPSPLEHCRLTLALPGAGGGGAGADEGLCWAGV